LVNPFEQLLIHCLIRLWNRHWFGGRANLERLQAMDITIRFGQVDIEPVDCIHDLGVLLDSSLSKHQHIARVTSACFFIFDGFTSSATYPVLDIYA